MKENLGFDVVLHALKNGPKIGGDLKACRAGWNGKGMWIGLHTESGEFYREACGTKVTYSDYIVMKTADDRLVPWVASHTDILADDWIIL